jgi:hypothetical protein
MMKMNSKNWSYCCSTRMRKTNLIHWMMKKKKIQTPMMMRMKMILIRNSMKTNSTGCWRMTKTIPIQMMMKTRKKRSR